MNGEQELCISRPLVDSFAKSPATVLDGEAKLDFHS